MCSVLLIAACALPTKLALAQAAEPDASQSRADEPTRVVLIASPGMEQLVVRFTAELDSLHLEVVRAPDADAGPSLLELEELARDHHARVAVRVSKAGSAIDLWVASPQSHELVYRRVVAGGDPAVLVLRSLEILRGALVDLRALDREPARPAPAKVAPPSPPPPRPPAEPAPSSWLGLSGAVLAPHAGRSFAGGVLVAFRQRVAARFALHAELLAPVSGWNVSGEGGSARIWLGSATVAALVNPWGDRWLSPGLGLGLGGLGLRTRGEAQPGYEGSNELHAALFPHGRVELGLRLTGSLRLRAALVGGFATPRPVLLFGEKREESWLNPLLISSLGIEATIP